MKKWFVIMLLVLIFAFGSVIGFNMFKAKKIKEFLAARPAPTFPVTVVDVTPETWSPHIEAIGFIEPKTGVDVSAELAGKVVEINFENGQAVKKGDVLIRLDVEVEEGNLNSALGRLPARKADYERMQILYKDGSVSQERLDDRKADYMSLLGEIQSLRGTLSRKIPTAPFDGVVGIRAVNLGQYLTTGTNIGRVEDTSIMRVRFIIAQTVISKVKTSQQVKIYVDAYPKQAFNGFIAAIEPTVFSRSGVVQVQADIPNSDGLLRSGMFAKVKIILPEIPDQIIIPQTAVTFSLYGESVFIMEDSAGKDGKSGPVSKQVVVEVVDRKGAVARIASGLQAGDKLITSGQVRLSNGTLVKVVESDALEIPNEIPAL